MFVILVVMNRPRRNSKALEEVFASGTKLKYEKGQLIIRQEETPQGVFFIDKGFIKSYDITKYGEENLLVMRNAGMVFPILWTLTKERFDVFYQAMSDVELTRITRDSYLEALEKDPELLKAILDQVLDMYRIHSRRVLNLEYRSARERIAFCIIDLAERFGKTTGRRTAILAPLRHHDIASSTNCSRETASREMSKLEKKKIITSKDGYIVILDMKGIKKIVES